MFTSPSVDSRHSQYAPHIGVLCEHCGGERQQEQEEKQLEEQQQQGDEDDDYEEGTDEILTMVVQNNQYNQRREADYQKNRDYDNDNETNRNNYNTAISSDHNNAAIPNYNDNKSSRTPWSTPREVVVSITVDDKKVAEFETTSPLPSTDRQRDRTVTKDALKRLLLEG